MPHDIAAALFPRTRRAVLSLLFGHSDQSFYLREIASIVGCGASQAQRELQQLSAVGIIRRFPQGRHIYFQANHDCAVFKELRDLVTKTVGAAGVLSTALQPFSRYVTVAFLYGSFARGEQKVDSDIDLFVIGTVTFSEVVSCLNRAETILRRDINPTVYPLEEFQNKLAGGNHFLQSVMKAEKIYLVGDEDELGKLA